MTISEPMSTFKLNSDQTVAVATGVYWEEDMATCPRGAKVQLLGQGGVAAYGNYHGDPFWKKWAPVPRNKPCPSIPQSGDASTLKDTTMTFPPLPETATGDHQGRLRTDLPMDLVAFDALAEKLHRMTSGTEIGLRNLHNWASVHADYDGAKVSEYWNHLTELAQATEKIRPWINSRSDAELEAMTNRIRKGLADRRLWMFLESGQDPVQDQDPVQQAENSGGNVSYYLCPVTNPNQAAEPYVAECGDIIEALNMDFNEATAFKSIWRKAAERTLGKKKAGNEARRDAEKVVFYGKRMLSTILGKKV